MQRKSWSPAYRLGRAAQKVCQIRTVFGIGGALWPTATLAALQKAEEASTGFTREYLEHVAADVQEREIRLQIATTVGRPHLQIIQYAETNQVDLIVMCTRGQSGLSRWLMGSVADRVVRGAGVPVLLVRARKEET